jgi:hypothetical protein
MDAPMSGTPLNLLHFVSMGNENLMVSLVEHENDVVISKMIQGFYAPE